MNTALREHRWALGPLLEVTGLSIGELRRRLDLKPTVISAAVAGGLTDVQADHWAIALDWHPLSVWGWDWVDLADRAATAPIRLAALLREQINKGDHRAGEPLPLGKDLAARYDISRNTVTRAFNALRDEGLVAIGQGRRYIVVDPGRKARAS